MTLRWEKQKDTSSFYAYSGELVVGMVGYRDDGTVWYDATNAVHMKGTAKTNGEVQTIPKAREMVERAWGKWLARAALIPAR